MTSSTTARDIRLTHELAALAGAPTPIEADRLLTAIEPTLTEWSFNLGDDPRGALRFGSWTDAHARAERVMRANNQEAACAIREQLPLADMEGLGVAWSADRPATFRWWLLASNDGTAMHSAVIDGCPELAEVAEGLAEHCGAQRCTAFGLESDLDNGAILRSTVYYAIYDPAVVIPVLEMVGCPPSPAANAFFRGLCGLDPRFARPWPKVWIGRSVGTGGGWKVYYFARGDDPRPSDDALLDLVSADERARKGAAQFRAEAGVAAAVQLLGLTFRDATPDPVWTTYLALR